MATALSGIRACVFDAYGTLFDYASAAAGCRDPDQSDLLDGLSGLAEIARRLDPIAGVAVVRLGDGDIVRHPLVAAMLKVL